MPGPDKKRRLDATLCPEKVFTTATMARWTRKRAGVFFLDKEFRFPETVCNRSHCAWIAVVFADLGISPQR
jgi:hypothetical protein